MRRRRADPGDDAERRGLHLRGELDDPLRIDRRTRPERLDAGAVPGVDRPDRPRQGRDPGRIGVRWQGRLDQPDQSVPVPLLPASSSSTGGSNQRSRCSPVPLLRTSALRARG